MLDIRRPDMTCYELAAQLRQLPGASAADFIALTGYGQAQDRERSREAGFDHHMVKPADVQRLPQIPGELGLGYRLSSGQTVTGPVPARA